MPYEYDFSWRAGDYLESLSPTERMLAGIQGANRRKIAERMLAAGCEDELDELLSSDRLGENEKNVWGAIRPSNMGGEYLPPLLRNEVEIARVTLASTTQDVFSIRARKVSRGWKYRVVDEYGEEGCNWNSRPKTSRLPLTFGRLVSLIDSALSLSYEFPGLVMGMLQHHVRHWDHSPEDQIGFVTVSSYFYSDLEDYYADAIAECLLRLSIEVNGDGSKNAGSGGEKHEPRRLDARFFQVLSEERERAVLDVMAALREEGDVSFEEDILEAIETLRATCKGLR